MVENVIANCPDLAEVQRLSQRHTISYPRLPLNLVGTCPSVCTFFSDISTPWEPARDLWRLYKQPDGEEKFVQNKVRDVFWFVIINNSQLS